MKKIAVIGGGISGISVAKMLNNDFDVTVLEKSAKIGGLVKCERVQDNLYHRVGGHVFNAKNKEVSDWFWSYFDRDKEFIKAKRNAKILYNGKLIGYPIENFLFEFDKEIVEKILSDLLAINNKEKKALSDYNNFEEFLKGNFGNTLYELYFRPYNNKIWNTDLSKVSLDWLEGKLPMPDLKQMLLSNIFREEEEGMVHSTFYYAKENGSQFIVDRLAEGLKIKTDSPITKIRRVKGGFILNDKLEFDKVIYCGDVRKLKEMFLTNLEEADENLNKVISLQSNGTSSLFCETDENDISWLYLPDEKIKAHRIIYTGNFSPSNNRGSQRKTCVVEFSGHVSLEQMKEEIKKLPGNLKGIAHNHEPNSYVIQDDKTRGLIQNIKRSLNPLGFFILGRFADWEYYNMDKAIEAAMEIKNSLS